MASKKKPGIKIYKPPASCGFTRRVYVLASSLDTNNFEQKSIIFISI